VPFAKRAGFHRPPLALPIKLFAANFRAGFFNFDSYRLAS
jgi:hypothetical protein